MLATRRQIEYLQHLTDRAAYLKRKHPALIPNGVFHKVWDMGMTSDLASARIEYMSRIVTNANNMLYGQNR